MQEAAIFSVLVQVLTWVIVIIGWIVVHRLTLKREKRREARERVDGLLKLLHDIEEKAIHFHGSDEFQEHLARSIRFEITRIIGRLKRFPFTKFLIGPDLKIELRQALTLKNFEPSSFSSQTAQSSIFTDITKAVDDLEEQIENEYERIYP